MPLAKPTTTARPPPSPACAAALRYARRLGWSVFPVRPLGSRLERTAYFSEQTTGRRWGASKDPATIEQMFLRYPSADIAIETGPPSGVIVIDVDNKKGKNGTSALQELMRAHRGDIPHPTMAESPNGGTHYYFSHPGRLVQSGTSKLGPGIDVLGDNLSVIVPPSRGRTWITHPSTIAPMPRWLVDLVCEERESRPRRSSPAPREQRPLSPEMLAMWTRDAGLGLSSHPDDVRALDDTDLKIWCALRVIPADIDYHDWFRIGCAIYAALGDDGFEHFDDWSSESQLKYSQAGCAAKWRDCSRAKRPPGPDTIYWLADNYDRGWRDAYRVYLAKELAS